MLLLFSVRVDERSQVSERAVSVLRERLSICECAPFRFNSQGGMWDFIVLVPNHCLSFYFVCVFLFPFWFCPFWFSGWDVGLDCTCFCLFHFCILFFLRFLHSSLIHKILSRGFLPL